MAEESGRSRLLSVKLPPAELLPGLLTVRQCCNVTKCKLNMGFCYGRHSIMLGEGIILT